MLSNAYFLAKIRFDTAENEPAKVLQKFARKKLIFANSANTPRTLYPLSAGGDEAPAAGAPASSGPFGAAAPPGGAGATTPFGGGGVKFDPETGSLQLASGGPSFAPTPVVPPVETRAAANPFCPAANPFGAPFSGPITSK